MVFVPKEAVKNRKTPSDVADHDKSLNQIWGVAVEVNSIEELDKVIDQEEQRLYRSLNQNYEGVGS